MMKKVIVMEKFIFHYYKGFKTILVFSFVLSMTGKRNSLDGWIFKNIQAIIDSNKRCGTTPAVERKGKYWYL